jgi:hypothetical protein
MFPAFLIVSPVLMTVLAVVYVRKRRARKASSH